MGNLKNSDVATKNITELLYKLNKTEYNTLKADNLSYDYLFNLGDILGEKEIGAEELKIKANLALETLKSIVNNSEYYFKKIKDKLNSYKRIELIFQIITALGGSALFVTLVKNFDEEGSLMKEILQYVGAIIATTGSILQVIMNKGLGAWNFNRRNRNDDYDVLVKSNLRAGRLLRNLEPKIIAFDTLNSYDETIRIINETNDLSENVGIVIADYK